jgi:hypothetical protein
VLTHSFERNLARLFAQVPARIIRLGLPAMSEHHTIYGFHLDAAGYAVRTGRSCKVSMPRYANLPEPWQKASCHPP